MAVQERTFPLQSKPGERMAHFFGRRLPAGTEVTVYEVEIDGRTWRFATTDEAEAFATSDWPKPLHGGWLTSDGVRFPDSKKAQAAARQANVGGAT